MQRRKKLIKKLLGFPFFHVQTNGFTFPLTHNFTEDLVGLDGLSLNLQFATDKTLTARKGPTPTFTRASTATFVGSNGLIQSAAINAARFDHDPVTLASRGLLIEESRTNLILQSEDFGTSWSAVNSTVSVNTATSPNGLVTADKLIVNLLSVAGRLSQNTTLTGSHTFSAFLKASEWSWAFITPSAAVGGVWFNLSNGTIGTQQAGCVGSIVSYGNGWYRCSVTLTGTGVASTTRITPTNADNTNTAGDGVSGIFAWGAQLETGAFPTSYIPTTTASVVRSADVCSITGSDFTSFYNQSEGTLFANIQSTGTGDRRPVAFDIGNNSQFYNFYATSVLSRYAQASGSLGSFTMAGTVPSTPLLYAGTLKHGDYSLALNGSIVGSSAVSLGATFIALRIGAGGGGGGQFLCGHLASIRYFKKRLTNAKLQTITA
jgi:hypothetical protein